MKRTFELKTYANDVGYSVELRINGRAFAASAIIANGDTVGSTYKQIVAQLAEVYGDIDRKPECADIAEAREQVYFTICSLGKIARLEGKGETQKIKRGDVVYISDAYGVHPYEEEFVGEAAYVLENDDILLKYAYGCKLTPEIVKGLRWDVIYVDDNFALICCQESGSPFYVIENGCLTIAASRKTRGELT